VDVIDGADGLVLLHGLRVNRDVVEFRFNV
jgi:hypothetical protein